MPTLIAPVAVRGHDWSEWPIAGQRVTDEFEARGGLVSHRSIVCA